MNKFWDAETTKQQRVGKGGKHSADINGNNVMVEDGMGQDRIAPGMVARSSGCIFQHTVGVLTPVAPIAS